VIARPLAAEAPTIDLVLGHHNANTSPLLRLLLSKTDDMIGRIAKRAT
jgi:LysR family transcriptional regulator, hca operon transcriptional activator